MMGGTFWTFVTDSEGWEVSVGSGTSDSPCTQV